MLQVLAGRSDQKLSRLEVHERRGHDDNRHWLEHMIRQVRANPSGQGKRQELALRTILRVRLACALFGCEPGLITLGLHFNDLAVGETCFDRFPQARLEVVPG